MNTPPPQKRASLHTLGCRLNQSETTLLAERLVAEGYTLVPFGEPADLAIINTCTVTHEADAKSRKMVRQFIRKNPRAYTAVVGCYAQMGAKALAAIPGVDLIIGNQEKLNVLDYMKQGKNQTPLVVRDRIDRDDFEIALAPEAHLLTHRANLKVQDGCDFMCSFCIIPFARGRARSRSLPNLVEEARRLVAQGSLELVLTGVNIGTYAWQGAGIVDVVDALNEIEGLARIRISSIEPTTVPEGLLTRMADPTHRLVPYLHLPLQAGSDRVLQTMRRRYSRVEYLDFVFHAHNTVPGIGIGTDILVGFPGETDEEFAETCDALWRSPLFYAHVFKYSAREGAASTRLPNSCMPATINARAAQLRTLSARKSGMFLNHHLGREVAVLFESFDGEYWSGYTPQYIRVAVKSPQDLNNQIRTVWLQSLHGDLVYGATSDTAQACA